MKKTAFILFSLIMLFLTCTEAISQTTPQASEVMKNPAVKGAIESGRITPGQVQEAVKALQSGKVSPGQVQQLKKEVELGNITPEEIEAGKKLLELKKNSKAQKAGKEPSIQKEPSPGEKEVLSDATFFKKPSRTKRAALKLFGHNLFSGTTPSFDPIKAIPVSDTYIVGPGDEIRVLMWGRIDASYELTVDSEGTVNFPKIGPLVVAGLTFGEVKRLIQQKTEAITGVNASVSMGRLRTIQVFVLGEVRKPGVYTISSLATVANALFFSGGPTPLGSMRKIEVKRHGKRIAVIDLYDFLLKGDTTADIRLMPGDVIFVPKAGPLVMVEGNVKRPAIYELRSEKELKKVLELAGGLSPKAYNQRIQIERVVKNSYQVVLDISLGELNAKKPVELKDGDIIQVFPVLPDAINSVYLYGNVLRPGEYEYKPGMRVKDILKGIESLSTNTFLDYALVKRYDPRTTKTRLIPFDIGALLLKGQASENVALMPKDEIYVFNKSMFQDRPAAEVKGEVRRPGRYFIDEMKVKDLILKAGDLTPEAYLDRAEIIRTNPDLSKTTIYFNLKKALGGDPAENIEVMDKDVVIVHSAWEKRFREHVSIEGEVKNPGTFALTKGMRISDLIFKAGDFTKDVYKEIAHLYRTDMDTKEVTIHTFSPARALEKDPLEDILLQDQDQVVIHSIWEYKQKYTVSIQGMVNNPGEYPYASNMTIKDLIFVAGNIRDGAHLDTAELVRYNIVEGKKVITSVIPFNIAAAIQGDPENNLPLNPLDTVIIKNIPDWWAKKKTVTIKGEVLFPGTYQIRKQERLSSIIERAGGFTEKAYLRGGFFTRESVRKIQQERIDQMIKRLELEMARAVTMESQQALSQESIEAQKAALPAMQVVIERLKAAKASGRVVVNFLPLDSLKGTGYDLVLEDGDEIFIPEKPSTVNVLGAVFNPTAIIYDPARPEAKNYLAMVGGPTANAEKDQMYIIRANGTVVSKSGESWFGATWDQEKRRWGFFSNFEDTRLFPGDTILVPEKLVRPNYMRDAKDITQILYQIAITTGILINQVF